MYFRTLGGETDYSPIQTSSRRGVHWQKYSKIDPNSWSEKDVQTVKPITKREPFALYVYNGLML